MNAAVPRIFFTHGNYLRNYTGDWETKVDFYGKKIIMLVRDPRDVAVSQFFQWKYRMKRNKKALNWYPPHGADVSLYDFVMNEDAGLPCIIEFFNTWARELPRVKASMVIRYEDMRKDPAAVLKPMFGFLGTPGSDAEIQDAVDFAAYENMKQLEEKNAFRSSGARLVPGNKSNPDSYKVRRAKVGGYRDYFDDEQLARIEALFEERMTPVFGYKVSS
jgi:alcohol sulfotransferase